MKFLLDESIPQKLRLLIDRAHDVSTTAFQGWSGLKNGALLTVAENAGFDLFITADQELTYQQNFSERRIALLILSSNNWSIVKAGFSEINQAIGESARELQVSRHRAYTRLRSRATMEVVCSSLK